MNRWERGRAEIDDLLQRGHLSRVPADREHALALLERASTALGSARLLLAADPTNAYNLAYESARLSLTATLAVQGLRPTTDGGHVAIEQAALAQLHPPLGPTIKRFSQMRRTRHGNEYPDRGFLAMSEEDAEEAISVAESILEIGIKLQDQLPRY